MYSLRANNLSQDHSHEISTEHPSEIAPPRVPGAKRKKKGSRKSISAKPHRSKKQRKRARENPLRILGSASHPTQWQLFAHILDFVLGADGPDDVVRRAGAALGLLPQVAWADLNGNMPPKFGFLAAKLRPSTTVATGRSPGNTHERLVKATHNKTRYLEVKLTNPNDPMSNAPVAWLLMLVERLHTREQHTQSLAGAAYTDPLTGLWNRRGFDLLLDQALTRAQRNGEKLALVLCDLDYFKSINDTYGHSAGDDALRAVSDSIGSVLRPSDIAARLGGDEIAILLSGTGIDGAKKMSERLRSQLRRTPTPGKRSLTMSMGLVDSSILGKVQLDAQKDSLIDAADQALYLAKAGGRDRAAASPKCVSETAP